MHVKGLVSRSFPSSRPSIMHGSICSALRRSCAKEKGGREPPFPGLLRSTAKRSIIKRRALSVSPRVVPMPRRRPVFRGFFICFGIHGAIDVKRCLILKNSEAEN